MMLTLVSRGNLWFTKWVGKTLLANNWPRQYQLINNPFSIQVLNATVMGYIITL